MNCQKIITTLFCTILVLITISTLVGAIGFSAENAYNAVFVVYSGENIGSGFAIGENCIISNAHVIGNKSEIVLYDYSGNKYSAQIVLIDESFDIVVLQVKDVVFKYLTVGDYNNTSIGEDVYAIGAPKSMAYTLTKGVLSVKERIEGRYKYLQIDAALNPGNSGGPLLNDQGEVIGVNTLKIDDSEGIGLSIPMTAVSKYLHENGIEINDKGNVTGKLTNQKNSPSNTETESNSVDNYAENNNKERSSVNFTLMALFVLSVAVNIILAVSLVFQVRAKNTYIRIEKKERTDFDIDILG